MYKSSIPRFLIACMVAKAALGTMIGPIQQDPSNVSPGLSVALTCTVNGVSHLCNGGKIQREEALNTLEWHIPHQFLGHSIYNGSNYGSAPFNNFSTQSLTFTPNCINGSLSSTLTFVVKREFKNTPFQCVLVIDQNHPLDSTGLKKLWSQAIALNVTVNTTSSTCPECLNTTCSTCPECPTLPPNTTVTTEPYAVTSITEDNITCTMCQTTCPPHGAASERSASIFSLILLLGLLIIMIVNLL